MESDSDNNSEYECDVDDEVFWAGCDDCPKWEVVDRKWGDDEPSLCTACRKRSAKAKPNLEAARSSCPDMEKEIRAKRGEEAEPQQHSTEEARAASCRDRSTSGKDRHDRSKSSRDYLRARLTAGAIRRDEQSTATNDGAPCSDAHTSGDTERNVDDEIFWAGCDDCP